MIETIEKHKMWTDSIVTVKPLASSAIMTNNITVSFTTFAAGITAGVGTVYMMLTNGVLIVAIGLFEEVPDVSFPPGSQKMP